MEAGGACGHDQGDTLQQSRYIANSYFREIFPLIRE